MSNVKALLISSIAATITSCAPVPSAECKSIPREKAIELAREQKRGMLSRSTEVYRTNFGSDEVVPAEGHGFADAVGFQGKDGQVLVALIYDDCYVGWTYQ